jgi:hypothetical protein
MTSMIAPLSIVLVAIMLVMTLGRIVYRPGRRAIDWALEVAFIRLDFPPQHRDIAQQIAAGLAEIVGMKIKQLRPEHSLSQIAEWAENQIHAKDLITLFVIAFKVNCDASTTFRDLVEKVVDKKIERGEIAAP